MLNYSVEKKTFIFKTPSGTSRGVLTEKHAWFVKFWHQSSPEFVGLGECSIIPGLSPDFENFNQYEENIHRFCKEISELSAQLDFNLEYVYQSEFLENISDYPSILFGIETALIELQNQEKDFLFPSPFFQSEKSIPINGLIWMGSKEFMQNQIATKISEGYTCIKMKIGAIDFETEFNLLKQIRNEFSVNDLILRVDANGAFSSKEALEKLNKLVELEIHSIEQPIAVNQLDEMQKLCSESMLPIALDEELIGITKKEDKYKLLRKINPPYIILKPSLHGGIYGTKEWISIAEELHIKWWITSALESNIGLNSIAQLAGTYDICYSVHQGLGTGSLYIENTPTRLQILNGNLINQQL